MSLLESNSSTLVVLPSHSKIGHVAAPNRCSIGLPKHEKSQLSSKRIALFLDKASGYSPIVLI